MGRHHKPSTTGRRIAQAAIVVTALPAGAALMGAGTASAGTPRDILDEIEKCESGGDPNAQNPSSTASGRFQFLDSTWQSLGGTGSASDASPAEQRRMAEKLYAQQGTAPWNASKSCWGGKGGGEVTPRKAAEKPAPQARKAPAVALARVWPLTSHRVTSGFGERWGQPHRGIDMPAPIGTPVYAAHAGRVISSGPASGFGLWVRVQAADGTITVYGHINRSLVHVGQQVRAGQQIAEVGNRGQSTGPHLHFEVWQGGRAINPLGWLAGAGSSGEQKARTQSNKLPVAPKAPAAPKAKAQEVQPARSGVPAGARFTPGGDGEYTVQLGDTLTHLAKVHGTTVEKLVELNTDIIEMPDWIFEGEKIHLR